MSATVSRVPPITLGTPKGKLVVDGLNSREFGQEGLMRKGLPIIDDAAIKARKRRLL
jgi:hypothetical protein